MLVNQPAILSGAFAAEGDKNTIPANNDGLSGLASIAKGFPPITQQPLAQGGLPPQRQDFNGIFNLFSQFLLFAQNGGVYAYNNTLDYQPPAIIASDNVFYRCVAENGPSTIAGVQPVTNTTYWEKLVFDIMTGASSSASGAKGMVPAPAAGAANRYLKADGTWGTIDTMNGASSSESGDEGLVPAPEAGEQNKFLRGDGTWADAKMSTKELVDILYPVGHIYMSTNSANPGTLFPGTTWEAYAQGRVLIGAGTGTDSRSEKKTFAAGSTGGEYNHQLTVGELAAHGHDAIISTSGKHSHGIQTGNNTDAPYNMVSTQAKTNNTTRYTQEAGDHMHTITISNTGSSAAHNNLPPYITAYIWRRTK